MGLLTNGYRDKIGVFKTYGGSFHNNSFPQGTLGNYNLTGAKRNLTAGEGVTDDKVGLPMGYVAKGWQLPQKAGFISSRDAALSVGGTGTMLMGYPIEGSASFSIGIADAQAFPLDDTSPLRTGSASLTFAVADAEGQLISSGAGSAAMTFTVADALLTASIGGTGSASFEITGAAEIGALASVEGSASMTFTVANAQALPLNDASPLRTGSAAMAFSGTLTPYAIGSMSGSTVAPVDGIDYTALSAAVRSEMATELSRIDVPVSTRSTMADIFAAV